MTTLKDLYRQLYRIRRVEEVIADEYPRQQMRCPVHLCIGQEAIAVGVSAELRHDDYVFSTHRSHAHFLAKGGSLRGLIAELYGKATGCSRGKGGSMHLIDLPSGFLGAAPILGATTALAVGAALGAKLRNEHRVTAAFFGDGALEEGMVYECINFAALHKLPVLLVCENNGLSTTSGLDVRQPNGRRIADMVRSIGMNSIHGDGNDVLEVLRIAREALHEIRSGAGPMFLEFQTYRWREHCGPNYDIDLGYRTKEEVDAWERKCPLVRLKNFMQGHALWNEAEIAAMKAEIETEILEAVQFAKDSPYPDESELLANEYAGDAPCAR